MGLPTFSEFSAALNRLGPVLLDTAIRSGVVLGLAVVAAVLMRRASAAARHWVWVLGVAGLVMLPVMSATLPGWNVLPRAGANRAVPVATVTPPVMFNVAEPSQNGMPGTAPSVSVQIQAPFPLAESHIAAPAGVAAKTPVETGGAIGYTPTAAPVALPWTFWIVLIWLAGSVLLLGHMLLGYLSLWSLQRRCARLREGHWAELLGQLCQQLQVRRPVELLSSTQRTMPMTWGLWRSRLLLPEEAGGWAAEQKKAVLLHELGHVKRWDCVAQLIAQIACALYWFNPLVWVAWNRMQVERERACDDLVLNTGARASTYAQHLLHSASALPVLRFAGAAVAMARPSTLEERLRAILDPQRNRSTMTTRSALVTTLLLVAALLPVAVLQAQEAPPTESPVVGPSVNASRPPATVPGRSRGGSVSFGGTGRGGAGPTSPLALGDGPTCALDATIYDVRLPVDKIGQLDVEALTRASGTAVAFEKALAELGTAVPLYRANQSVRLTSDNITIATETPYITNSQARGDGQVINTVSYRQTGAIFNLAGKGGAPGNVELDLNIQVSSISEGGTPITTTVKAPIFRTATLAHKGPVVANQPFVVMSVDAASLDGNGKAVAYIARITLGPPQSSPPARGE